MNEDDKSIIKFAVFHNTLKNVEAIFDRHKLVKDNSFFDYELLKGALERRHISIANFLLKIGCRVKNPNTINSEETALHLAMKVNNAGIIKKMLRNGASIDDKNLNGDTALYAAFIGGYSTAVSEALTYFVSTYTLKHSEDFSGPSFNGIDPTNVDNIRHFQIACVTNHHIAVKYFLKYNFDVNSPLILNSTEFFGSNPLHYAISKYYTECIVTLLERGGDISIKNSNGKTPLQIIYYSGFPTEYTGLIEHVFNRGNHTKFINSVDNNGVSHFHMSCAINYSEYVQVFIDKGVDVNRPISSNCSKYPGYTPLHIAVMLGCEKVVQLLLKNGADCKEKSTDGTTPLHLACNLHEDKAILSIIHMLLKYNASPDAVDNNSCTPLHLIFWNNLYLQEETQMKIFYKLIPKIPRDINITDNQGLSYFHLVCIGNDISRVNDFLQQGVDINSCVKLLENYSGYTALHFAVLYNHKDLVEVLLKWNAQVNIQTNHLKLTPLHLACNFDRKKFIEMNIKDKLNDSDWVSNCLDSQLEIIKLLLLHGADVDAQDFLGQTPLRCTFQIKSAYLLSSSEIRTRIKQIIEILLLNKANINACTHNQQSILHIVSEYRYLNESDREELVEYLLTKGANVHAVNNAGFTLLHEAVRSCKEGLVKIFLKYQADVNAKSENFLIPLQMIIQYDFFPNKLFISSCSNDVVCPLLENDSYVNVRSGNSKTLLQAAIESRNTFVIKKLLDYGADINMEHSFGKSTVSSLFDWDNEREDKVLFASVLQIVFTHVQKLLALGLYVSERVQTCCIQLHQRYQSLLSKNLDNVFDNCLEELNKMKLVKIDNYTSLYNILLKDAHEISKHVRNSSLVQILKDPDVDNNFPLYSFLLKLNFKNGLKRSDVLKLAKAALHYTIKLNLPDLCCNSILKYLANEDIINLKAAVSINNCKRKLNSDDSCNMEPSEKLTKN